jgi:hypothetical protein
VFQATIRCYGRGTTVGRGLGVGVALGVGVTLGVEVGVGVSVDVDVAVGVAVGLVGVAVAVGVGVGVAGCAQYFPPVFRRLPSIPPQMIISLPLQTPVCHSLPSGTLVVLVTLQLSVSGLYLPPVLKFKITPLDPPQTIISLSVQTAVS